MKILLYKNNGGTNNPIIYDKNYNFEIGKAIKLKNGEDVVIFGSGSVLDECLKVAELLEEKISAK